MGIFIKEADIDKDKNKIIELFNANRKNDADSSRFDWLYKANPYGKAKVWFAVDDKTQEVAGFTSVLPRMAMVFGEKILCWNCCDFSINKKYRTLGVALKLRKAAKDDVDKNIVPFLYAHPNDRMKVIHQKVGHNVIGEMVRYARPLRLDRLVAGKIKNPIISNLISYLGNLIMKSWAIIQKKSHPSIEFKVYKESEFTFNENFDKLLEKGTDDSQIYGIRENLYLNWRYIENPLYCIEVALIKRKEQLLGYVIYVIEDGTARMKDIFSIGDTDIDKILLSNWIHYLQKRGINSISAIFLETNNWLKVFKKFGFMRRPEDTSSVVIYSNTKNRYADKLINADNWYMTVGDRDV